VLGAFTAAEAAVIQPAQAQAAQAALRWFDHGITRAMTEFNSPSRAADEA
jgi:hypothetical protein